MSLISQKKIRAITRTGASRDPLAESCRVRARSWCAEVASSYVTRLFALSLSLSTSFSLFTSAIDISKVFLIKTFAMLQALGGTVPPNTDHVCFLNPAMSPSITPLEEHSSFLVVARPIVLGVRYWMDY